MDTESFDAASPGGPATYPPARRVLAVGLAAHPVLTSLEGHGLSVRHVGLESSAVLAPASGAEIVVAAFGDERQDERLDAIGAHARLPGVSVALLGFDPGDAAWARAAAITPFCYPASLPGPVLAGLILAGVEGRAAPAPAPAPAPRRSSPRVVALRPWESVEVDGVPVYLGVAERNFLFLLASRPGERLSKDEDIDVGGRTLPASTCRRRLGQRLGPELAELLIPQERFEPYRLRSPAEVERLSQDPAGRNVPTLLRIHGRGSVHATAAGRMESVATVA